MSQHSIEEIQLALFVLCQNDDDLLVEFGVTAERVLSDAITELAALRAWRDRAVPLLRGSQQALDVAIDAICDECGIDHPFDAARYETMRDLERDLRALLAESVAPHD